MSIEMCNSPQSGEECLPCQTSRAHTSPPQVGDTALGMASQEGHQEVVRLLLQSGAKDIPNKVNPRPACAARVTVLGLSICLSLLQLASRTFIRPKNNTTCLAGHVDGYVRTNLSENSPLQS